MRCDGFTEHKFLVVDCGGGTTDFSKLVMTGIKRSRNKYEDSKQDQEGAKIQYTLKNTMTTGVTFLGGQEFSNLLLQFLKKKFQDESKINIEELENNEKMNLINKLEVEIEKYYLKTNLMNFKCYKQNIVI